ncbi:MAG: UDP-N-acetylmuramoyl-L-alanyl-D-glutamate--2,6-diaminopimelate ligase [Pseudomonadales bacterium]
MTTRGARPIVELLRGMNADVSTTISVPGVRLDSRTIQPGELFVAVRSGNSHGAEFIDSAIANGAGAVLVDQHARLDVKALAVPCIVVENLEQHLGEIAHNMYGKAGQELAVFAVTGTNGKTSCCSAYASLHSRLGASCGFIGTLGWGVDDNYAATGYTTPDVFSTHEICAELLQRGCAAVAMEVSSHALAQNRIAGIAVRTAVFTNLTHDHLDYHASEADYAAQKSKLFERESLTTAVLNIDDALGEQLATRLKQRPQLQVLAYSVGQKTADVWADDIVFGAQGMRATVHSPWGSAEVTSKLFGEFNLSNLLAVISSLCAESFEFERVIEAVSELEGAAGRMQTVPNDIGLHIVIDYAHTPDALQNALAALRRHCTGQLWVVFGCGGDRDKSKRAPMGKIAELLADHVVVTNDNPRTEAEDVIAADIVSGISKLGEIHIELDRARAIEFAVQSAHVDDCVLVAGKGHEDYQEVNNEKLPFDDFSVVQSALSKRTVH